MFNNVLSLTYYFIIGSGNTFSENPLVPHHKKKHITIVIGVPTSRQ